MTSTFSIDSAVPADVLGARAGLDPDTGGDAIAIALASPSGRPQVFTLTLCDAFHLREALAEALVPPNGWFDDDEVALLHPSVRWDETWTVEP